MHASEAVSMLNATISQEEVGVAGAHAKSMCKLLHTERYSVVGNSCVAQIFSIFATTAIDMKIVTTKFSHMNF